MTLLAKAREILAIQLDRLMKVGSVLNTSLLVLNLSLAISTVLQWRGGSLWMWVIGSAIVISALMLVFTNLWTQKFDMVRALRKASAIHDAPQVYQMMPWERVVWLHVVIPQMLLQAEIADKLGVDSASLRTQIQKLKRWESLGFIPREEYPKHLLRYYWHTEGEL